MLPHSPTPLLRAAAAAVVALALGAASAGAASLPITPVLTGGKVTYTGGVSGNLTSGVDGDGTHFNEHANLDFSSTSYAGDLFGPRLLVSDGGASAQVRDYTSVPGTGNTDARFRDDRGAFKTVTCTFNAQQITAPPVSRATADGRLILGGVGYVDWAGGATCSPREAANGSTIGSLITGAANAPTVRVGGAAPTGNGKDFNVTMGDSGPCPIGASALANCRYDYSGTGQVHVECALCLTSMQLEQHDLPSGNLMDVPAAGTTDGNHVIATATFTNRTAYTIRSMVKWRERVGRRTLLDAGGSVASPIVTFPAGAQTVVTLEWDTNGFAWERGRPASDRQLEVTTGMGGGYVAVKVLPKPIIAVHGWNADYHGWDVAKVKLPGYVHPELRGRIFAVGDEQGIGIMNTDPSSGNSIAANAAQEKIYIQTIREKTDAEHVDLLVHSMGGLISRYYVQNLMPMARDGMPVASHLMMLGTPNMGSPCADIIGLIADGIPTQQLKPSYVDGVFDRQVVDKRGVPFSIIAGDTGVRTCQSSRTGDGVVEVESAFWTLQDRMKTFAQHLEETDLPSIYDGFVRTHVNQDPDAAMNPFQTTMGGSGASLRERAAVQPRDDEAPAAPADPTQAALVQHVTVPAGGSVDVPVTVGTASALVVGTTAPSSVSMSLVAPDGTVAATDDPNAAMRFARAEQPTAGGWKVRFTQSGGTPVVVGVVAAFEGTPLTMTTSGAGTTITATLRDSGTPVHGATVTADLRAEGQPSRTVTLTEGAGGTYSASPSLPEGDWYGTVHAHTATGDRYREVTLGSDSADTPPAGDPAPTPVGDDPTPAPGGHAGDQPPATGGGATPSDSGGSAAVSAPRGTAPATSAASSATLVLTAKAARVRRAPFTFMLNGRITGGTCTAGTTVAITISSGRRVVTKATIKLTRACTFAARVKVRRRGSLSAVARTATLSSRPLTLRAG
jgi:hypothetical protein